MIRKLHEIYARLFGYFWLPCPVCHRDFGGHEIANVMTGAVLAEDGHAYCVCPDPACSAAAYTIAQSSGQPYITQP